jgi:hypothetical protein
VTYIVRPGLLWVTDFAITSGFPLNKAQEYVDLHPEVFVLNDIPTQVTPLLRRVLPLALLHGDIILLRGLCALQNLLFDRREVYSILIKAGEIPPAAIPALPYRRHMKFRPDPYLTMLRCKLVWCRVRECV